MKNVFRKIIGLILNLLSTYAFIYHYEISEINGFMNIAKAYIIFGSVLMIIIAMFSSFDTKESKELKETILKSYRDKKHLPLLLDHATYLFKLLVLVYYSYWFLSALWFICYLIDITCRNLSTKIKIDEKDSKKS